MDMTTTTGVLAACCTTASYFPQLKKCWETEETGDLSLGMLLTLFAGLSLWIVYGVLRSDAVVLIANAVSLCFLAGILFFKIRETIRRSRKALMSLSDRRGRTSLGSAFPSDASVALQRPINRRATAEWSQPTSVAHAQSNTRCRNSSTRRREFQVAPTCGETRGAGSWARRKTRTLVQSGALFTRSCARASQRSQEVRPHPQPPRRTPDQPQ